MESDSEVVEFPVIIDESNEVLTLFLSKEIAARASQGIKIYTYTINYTYIRTIITSKIKLLTKV